MQKYTKKVGTVGNQNGRPSKVVPTSKTSVSQKEENIYTKISFLEKILWRNGFLGKIKGTDQRVPDTKDSASLIKGSAP